MKRKMLMMVVQLGSISIMLKWVILGIVLFLGLIFLYIWLRATEAKDTYKRIMDILSNGLFIGFISWKASLLILDPQLVIRSPLSLLYFTGGSNGLLIAMIITFLYVCFKLKKMNLSEHFIIQIVLFFSLASVGSYQIFAAILLRSETIYHLTLAFVTFLLFVVIIIRKCTLNGLFNVIIIWLFSMVVLQLTLLPRSDRVFLFTLEQWFLLSVMIVSLIYINKKSVGSGSD